MRLNREITVERKVTTQDSVHGTDIVTWEPLSYLPGSPAVAERYRADIQDVLPSRSESVTQGLAVAKNQSRVRMRWRDDIDSSMRVTVHADTDVLYQIVAGPADFGGRKDRIEFVIEKYSTEG